MTPEIKAVIVDLKTNGDADGMKQVLEYIQQ